MELTAWLLGIGGAVVAGLVIWMVQRSTARIDALDERIHTIEIRMAQELVNKGDLSLVSGQVEEIRKTMMEVRDWMIRLEEREKHRVGG